MAEQATCAQCWGRLTRDGSTNPPTHTMTVILCPKHAAVDALLEACKAMQKACDEWAAEFTQKKRAMDWRVVNDAYVKAERAIAQAEAKP